MSIINFIKLCTMLLSFTGCIFPFTLTIKLSPMYILTNILHKYTLNYEYEKKILYHPLFSKSFFYVLIDRDFPHSWSILVLQHNIRLKGTFQPHKPEKSHFLSCMSKCRFLRAHWSIEGMFCAKLNEKENECITKQSRRRHKGLTML